MAELANTSPGSNQAQFTWGGGVEVGHTVAPGVYVVQIRCRQMLEMKLCRSLCTWCNKPTLESRVIYGKVQALSANVSTKLRLLVRFSGSPARR